MRILENWTWISVTEVIEVKRGQVRNITMDSVTLYMYNNGKSPILNHLDRQFACTRVGLSSFHDISSAFSVDISIHGLKCWRITRHSIYIIHQSPMYFMRFPNSRSVYRSIHGSRETPSRPCWKIFRHSSSIQIISIQIYHIFWGRLLIVIGHVFVIVLSISICNIANSTAQPFFDELEHVNISHQFKLYICHF